MATCPTCRTPFEGDAQFCPRDGTPLIPAAPTDVLIGRVLGGRYRLLDRLGQGGMGTVYRAVHTLMDKRMAVKILRGDHAGDPDAIARFHREARSASRLDHEHCIRVTDFGQSDDGLLYLVMELLDGESLGALLRRGPIAARRASSIAFAVGAALQHAHEQGVVHRDLKPDNVFLARRGRRDVVKVLDFGLARIIGSASGEISSGPSITKAGVVFGTPEYMAPEQAEGGTVDARTDLYALGGLLYHMLTGELPFRAATFLALLSKQVEEQPEPPRRRRPDLDIPEQLEAIVLRCLEKRPEARFQTASEVSDGLAAFVDPATPSAQIPQIPLEGALDGPRAEHLDRSSSPRQIDENTRSNPAFSSAPPPDVAGPSVMSGEVMLPPRRRGLALGLGAAGVAVLGAGATLAIIASTRPHLSPATALPAPPVNPAESALRKARRLIDRGDLDAADHLLGDERAHGDGAELQSLLGEAALLRGNRLGALAHFYRATRIAPTEAEPHARLGSLLALLGQRDAACRESRSALRRDPANSMAHAAATAARCPKETP